MRLPLFAAGAMLAFAVVALLSSILDVGGTTLYVGGGQQVSVAHPTPSASSPPSQFAVYSPPAPYATAAPAPPAAAPPPAAPPPAAPQGGGGGDHHHH